MQSLPYGTRNLLLAACFMTLPFAAKAEIDFKQGVWGHLVRYIGTYDYDAVLNDKAVSARLTEILGDDLSALRTRLNVHAPIGFAGICLNLLGNAPHRGGIDGAYVNVCTNGHVDIVLASEDGIEIYTTHKEYGHLNWPLRAWVQMWHSGLSTFSKLPADATFNTIE